MDALLQRQGYGMQSLSNTCDIRDIPLHLSAKPCDEREAKVGHIMTVPGCGRFCSNTPHRNGCC
jgi:hypothetical protein